MSRTKHPRPPNAARALRANLEQAQSDLKSACMGRDALRDELAAMTQRAEAAEAQIADLKLLREGDYEQWKEEQKRAEAAEAKNERLNEQYVALTDAWTAQQRKLEAGEALVALAQAYLADLDALRALADLPPGAVRDRALARKAITNHECNRLLGVADRARTPGGE